MQLIPGRYFTVVRQIGNHTDANTYYVQAVIRDAYKDTILDTLQLTDKGGQRFKKDWLVPQEPVGEGAFISIVTSVYTDSAYTTKSENYSDEESTYLWAPLPNNHGRGGSSVDYRRIGDMMDEKIKAIPPIPTFPEIPTPKEYEMRWDEILSSISDVKTLVEALPKENNDDTPIIAKLDDVLGAIEAKEVTPVTDLSPVLDKLAEDSDTGEINHEELKSMFDGLENNITGKISETVSSLFDQTSFVTSFATHVAKEGDMTARHKKMMQQNMKEANTPPAPPPEPIDHEAIANSLSS